MNLPITLACSHYDRTEALRDGRVRVQGVDLTYLDLPVEEIFFRMARFREFDAAEMSLSSYVLSRNAADHPFVAIPVFPSRMFRHSSVYVHAASGITEPGQLAGRVVGLAEYQLTANVWVRGIFAEQYGLDPASVRYRTGGLHDPGRAEKIRVDVPEGIEIGPLAPTETLADLLVRGEIDAVYTPRTPEPFRRGDPNVRRLFADPQAEEQRYYRETGVFPIMHVVVLRREVYERNRWLASSLFTAFEAARRLVVGSIDETAALTVMLPWLHDEVRRTRELLGDDYWTYGLAGNEQTLRTFLRYSHDQGLADRIWEPAELFAPEALERTLV
jgi:4,5-dihydroxyphthalate decarboxylase